MLLFRASACLLVICGAFSKDLVALQDIERVDFEELFEWTGRVDLQETEAVLNVAPQLHRDPLGGWIVLDAPEAQIRLYDRDGRLRAYFGREGEGPREFRALVGVARLESGLLAAAERTGRVSIWAEDGSEFIDSFNTKLTNITHVVSLADSLLIATRPMPRLRSENRPSTLHVLDISTEAITRSFLQPRIPANAVAAMATVSGGGLARSRDALLVTLPLIDSLWVYPPSGVGAPETLHLPSEALGGPASIPDGFRDPEGMRGWLRSATFVGGVFGTAEAGWAVMLLRYGRGSQPGLLYLPPSRAGWVEVPFSPVLLGMDEETGEFVFQDPETLIPGKLRFASVAR